MKGHHAIATIAGLAILGASWGLGRAQSPASRASVSPSPDRRPTVVRVLTATADVHDAVVSGNRVLLATSGGLVTLRGDRVAEVRTARDGLPGARVRSVSETPEGLWVGTTEGAALVRWTEDGRFEVANRQALPRVTRVVRWNGATWFAAHGGGLHRLADGADARPETVSLGRSWAYERLTDLLPVGGELWVATSGAGVVRLGADGRVAGRIRARQGLPDDFVWDLEARGEDVLVATLGGLGVVRGGAVVARARETLSAQRLHVRDVRSVRVAGDGIVVATWGAGAWRIGSERNRPELVGTPDTRARVAFANGGRILVGHDAGLDVSTGDGGSVVQVRLGGLPSADVTALARAFGSVWIGTFGSGLARIERGRVVPVPRATERWGVDRRVNDLAVTRGSAGERLWIATDRGLYWHDGSSFVAVTDGQAPGRVHVTSLHVDARGDLWVTSSRQLSRLSGDRWESWAGDERAPIANLHAVTTDPHGNVWVGSLHGLLRFDQRTGVFERHTVSSGALPVDWVTAIVPWGEGIVAGTYHGGLSFFDGRSFRLEREGRGGIPAGWVNPHAITVVGGSLWIGTLDRGLVVGRPGAWTRLGVADGLPCADVTAVLPDGDGHLWVATRAGIARVRGGDEAPVRAN